MISCVCFFLNFRSQTGSKDTLLCKLPCRPPHTMLMLVVFVKALILNICCFHRAVLMTRWLKAVLMHHTSYLATVSVGICLNCSTPSCFTHKHTPSRSMLSNAAWVLCLWDWFHDLNMFTSTGIKHDALSCCLSCFTEYNPTTFVFVF